MDYLHETTYAFERMTNGDVNPDWDAVDRAVVTALISIAQSLATIAAATGQEKRPVVFTDGERLIVLERVAGYKPLPDGSLHIYIYCGDSGVTFNPEYKEAFLTAYREWAGLATL